MTLAGTKPPFAAPASKVGLRQQRSSRSCVGTAQGSLAKHKLLYGAIPCRAQAPADMPVYLKLSPTERGLVFNIAECEPVPAGIVSLDDMRVRQARRLLIPAEILPLA